MNNVNIKNKFKPTILFIVLFLLMIIFPYIPLEIFRIDLDKLSFNYKVLYNFMCDIGFMIILFMIYKNELIIKFKEYFKNFMENIPSELLDSARSDGAANSAASCKSCCRCVSRFWLQLRFTTESSIGMNFSRQFCTLPSRISGRFR